MYRFWFSTTKEGNTLVVQIESVSKGKAIDKLVKAGYECIKLEAVAHITMEVVQEIPLGRLLPRLFLKNTRKVKVKEES